MIIVSAPVQIKVSTYIHTYARAWPYWLQVGFITIMMIEELDPCNSRLFLLTSKERIRVHEITTPRESTVKAELLLFHREKFWWHICWFKENISKNTLWTNIQHISHMYFVGCCINLIPSGRAKKRKGILDVSKGLNLLWFYDLSSILIINDSNLNYDEFNFSTFCILKVEILCNISALLLQT